MDVVAPRQLLAACVFGGNDTVARERLGKGGQALLATAPIPPLELVAGLENTDFLQAVSLLASYHGPTATTARKEDILKLELDHYLAWAPEPTLVEQQ